MKNLIISGILVFVSLPLFATEDKLTNEDFGKYATTDIPQVECSVSMQPLTRAIVAELLGYPYEWKTYDLFDGSKNIDVNYTLLETMPSKEDRNAYSIKTRCGGSEIAIKLLTDKTADIIFIARDLTQAEINDAASVGVEIIRKPICTDALTFIINSANKVDNLSVEQIQKIYTGEITNWTEVGGEDKEIIPFDRLDGTACQEAMQNIVMNDLKMLDCQPQGFDIYAGPFYGTYLYPNGIGFMTNYHFDNMAPSNFNPKEISINNVLPDKNTIADGSAPFLITCYVAIRADLDTSSLAYKIYEYITTDEGKELLTELGYTPTATVTDIPQIQQELVNVYYHDGVITTTSKQTINAICITDLSGKIVLNKKCHDKNTTMASLPKGYYIVSVTLENGEVYSEKLIIK
jgi:phosphate transport system substrate-binding protein